MNSPSAFEAMYRAEFAYVWCVLQRLGVDAADRDDATQDVFVIAHRRLAEYEGRGAVRTWLYSIALRVAANRRRKAARRSALLGRMPRPTQDDLEELAARGQARSILDALLGRLDEHKRTVFVLAELEGLTVPAIAEIVGENPRTIYSRLRAARARVATELEGLRPPMSFDAAVTAGRARPDGVDRRAPRVWAAIVGALFDPPATAALATAGASWLKIAIAGGVAASVAAVVIAQREPERARSAAVETVIADRDPAPGPAAPAVARIDPPIARADLASPLASTSPVESAPAEPRSKRPAAKSTVAPTPPASSDADALAREVAALDDVRNALARGDAKTALASLDEHAARFGASGMLRGESTKLRVAALCRAGRVAEADAAAEAAGLPKACTTDAASR